jgi:hypothetical protein
VEPKTAQTSEKNLIPDSGQDNLANLEKMGKMLCAAVANLIRTNTGYTIPVLAAP